jgi:hypothetical protein
MAANVLLTGVAAAVPIEARHRLKGANIKRLTQYVSARAPTSSLSIVLSPRPVASLRLNHREITLSILRSGTRAIFAV